MMKNDAQTVYGVLNSLDIKYEATGHKAALTMEDCAEPSNKLGAPFCKNLFLQNRQGTEFFLLLIREDKRFRTADVSKKIGRARLSFGNDAKLFELLGLMPGAISPMGLIHDQNREIVLLMDRDLLNEPKLCFHPCVNTQSLSMGMSDFLDRFLPYTGHNPVFIEICEE